MKMHILPAIKLTIISILFFSGIYMLVVLGIAYVVAPNYGEGETLQRNGKIVGYALIGQRFTDDKYFWSRPSAVAYNAAGSAGSNKGPSNPDYLNMVQQNIDTFLAHNPTVNKADVPVEMVTMSGSGLDPDISPKAAMVQISRIALVRGVSEQAITKLVNEQTESPLWGLFGPTHVNVLKLNIELDKIK